MRAVYGIVQIKPDRVEEVSKGGIIIPDATQNKDQAAQMIGTIVGFGGNCFETWNGDIPDIGDRVIYNRYAGFTVTINGEKYRGVSDDDIHFILDEGDTNE